MVGALRARPQNPVKSIIQENLTALENKKSTRYFFQSAHDIDNEISIWDKIQQATELGHKFYSENDLAASGVITANEIEILLSDKQCKKTLQNIYNLNNSQKTIFLDEIFKYNHNNLHKIKTMVATNEGDVNAPSNKGDHSLLMAIRPGNLNLVIFLVENGAKIDLANNEGVTALMKACHLGAADIVSYLLSKNAQIDLADKVGHTALMYAAGAGQTPIAALLLERGAEINSFSTNGDTPLSYAASRGCYEVVELLIAKGADIHTLNTSLVSPLMKAVQGGSSRVAELLIINKANINQLSNKSVNALMCAANMGSVELVLLLLKHGAYLDSIDDNGNTAMHTAVKRGHKGIVQILLKHGAIMDSKNKDGKTPVTLATENNEEEIQYLLESQIIIQHANNLIEKNEDRYIKNLLHSYATHFYPKSHEKGEEQQTQEVNFSQIPFDISKLITEYTGFYSVPVAIAVIQHFCQINLDLTLKDDRKTILKHIYTQERHNRFFYAREP